MNATNEQPTIELQGRSWQAQQIEEIGHWVKENPTWSRYRLSRELCARIGWVRPNGQMADMAARSVLGKLQARSLIQLPPCRRASPNRMKHRQMPCVALERSPVEGDLESLGVLELHEVSRDPVRRAVFEPLLAAEHYLGYAASNWLELGLTQGRTRGDRQHAMQVSRKAVYVYPLSGQARERLRR